MPCLILYWLHVLDDMLQKCQALHKLTFFDGLHEFASCEICPLRASIFYSIISFLAIGVESVDINRTVVDFFWKQF